MGSTRQGEFSQRPCCEHDAGTGSLPVPDLNFWSLATPPTQGISPAALDKVQ